MTHTIGERLVDIFQPSPNGRHTLNLSALTTLINWAEGDEALAQRFGTWDQGVWSQVLLGDPTLAVDNTLEAEQMAREKYMDGVTQDTVFEETRNGVCQTAYCMAGQTVVQAGYRLIYTIDDASDADDGTGLGAHATLSTDVCVKQEWTGRFDGKGKPIFRDTGERMPISDAAAEVLGLDWREQAVLFDGSNEIDDLKYFVNAFCRRRGMEEPYPDAWSQRAENMWAEYEQAPLG